MNPVIRVRDKDGKIKNVAAVVVPGIVEKHASSHAPGGTDELTPEIIGAKHGFRKSLATNGEENIDKLLTDGSYLSGNTALSKGMIKGDLPFSSSFSLDVTNFDATGQRVRQIAGKNDRKSPGVKRRITLDGGESWSGWDTVFTSVNPPTAAEVGAVAGNWRVYRSYGELGLKLETATMQDIMKAMPDCSEAILEVGVNAPDAVYPTKYGTLHVYRRYVGRTYATFVTVGSDAQMYFGGATSSTGGTFDKWIGPVGIPATYTATVTTTWTASGDYFYQDIAVSGILATDTPVPGIVFGSDNVTNVLLDEEFGKVFRITTSANSIRVWATEETTVAFPIQLKVVR